MLRALGAAYYVALSVFLVIYIRQLDWGALAPLTPDYRYVIAASLLGLGYRFWGVVAWLEMLRRLGAEVDSPRREIAYVYAKAWMGRYLPGKVTWILGKVWFGSKLGVSKERLALGALVESSQQILVTLILAVVLLSVGPRSGFTDDQSAHLLVVAGSAVAFLLLMYPAPFNFILSVARRLFGRQDSNVSVFVTRPILIRGASLQTVGFAISGLSYVLLARAIDPSIPISDYAFVAGAFNLAGAVGVLAVFAPSGLGVREGVQLVLLPSVMVAEMALVLTVVARVWSTSLDLLFFVVTFLFRPRP